MTTWHVAAIVVSIVGGIICAAARRMREVDEYNRGYDDSRVGRNRKP